MFFGVAKHRFRRTPRHEHPKAWIRTAGGPKNDGIKGTLEDDFSFND